MNLQQLHIIREAARRGFNLTDVAKSMSITQPAVSRHIRELETELSVLLFQRHGKRLLGLTQVGQELLTIVNRMLEDAHTIRQLAKLFAEREEGDLRIASQHVLACHQLPQVIRSFRRAHPNVQLSLLQGSEQELIQQLQAGKVDLLVSTTPPTEGEALEFIPCCSVPCQILLREDHPLLLLASLTLTQLAAFPLITYPAGTHCREQIDRAFEQQGLKPHIPLTTHDATLISHYVSQDLGIGIIPGLVSDQLSELGLQVRDASHLFTDEQLGVLIKKGTVLPQYASEFIQLCRSELSQFLIPSSLRRPLPQGTYQLQAAL